jgi:hypothetical protein
LTNLFKTKLILRIGFGLVLVSAFSTFEKKNLAYALLRFQLHEGNTFDFSIFQQQYKLDLKVMSETPQGSP